MKKINMKIYNNDNNYVIVVSSGKKEIQIKTQFIMADIQTALSKFVQQTKFDVNDCSLNIEFVGHTGLLDFYPELSLLRKESPEIHQYESRKLYEHHQKSIRYRQFKEHNNICDCAVCASKRTLFINRTENINLIFEETELELQRQQQEKNNDLGFLFR